MQHTLSPKAIRQRLIELAESQVALGEDCTERQRSMFRSTAQYYLPAQDPMSLLHNWASVVATTKMLRDLDADVKDACWTYAGIEFPRQDEWTALENEAHHDRNDALDKLLTPARVVLTIGGAA